jgi:predicted ATP-binding protein involved in virulence
MSKRKAPKASKRMRGSKISAQPQRTKQHVVRGPKSNPPHALAAGTTESLHDEAKPELPVVENETTALQHDVSPMMTSNNSGNWSDFSLAIAYMQAFQAKLFEMGQANMQLAFEFTQRIAATRSPFEILSVLIEFTSKPIDMFQKYTKELAELNTRRLVL